MWIHPQQCIMWIKCIASKNALQCQSRVLGLLRCASYCCSTVDIGGMLTRQQCAISDGALSLQDLCQEGHTVDNVKHAPIKVSSTEFHNQLPLEREIMTLNQIIQFNFTGY